MGDSDTEQGRLGAPLAANGASDRYLGLVEGTSYVAYATDLEGFFTYVSPGVLRLTGYTDEETVGMHFTSLVHPDWREEVSSFYLKQLDRGTPETHLQFPVVTKSDEMIWVEQAVTLSVDGQRTTGCQAIVHDITLRKQVEEALLESEAKFRALAESTTAAVFIVRGEHIVYSNVAGEAMSGYSQRELHSMRFWELAAPDFRELVAERGMERQRGEDVPQRYEMKILTGEGEERWIDVALTVIEYEAKPALLGTAFDVTERREAAEALERRFEERTVQLQSANAQLRHELAERSRAEQALEREVTESTVLGEIGIIVGSSLDIDKTYERFADSARKLIPFDRMSIDIVDVEDGTGAPAYQTGSAVLGREVGDIYPLKGSSVEAAIRAGSGLLRSGTDLDELSNEFPGLRPAVEAGYRSFITVPLVSADAVVGAIVFHHKDSDAYSPHDFRIAGRIGAQVAGTFANSELHSRLRRESREREVLAEISRIIGSGLDVDEMYERLATELGKLIAFDRISIATAEGDSDTLTHVYVAGEEIAEWTKGKPISISESINRSSVQTRRGQLMGSDLPDQPPTETVALRAGFRSGMSIPLVWNDEVIGTFNIRSKARDAYTQQDVELAEHVASQVAGVIAHGQVSASLRTEANERLVLVEIGQIMSSTLDIDEVYGPFKTAVQELLPLDRIIITIADFPEGRVIETFVADRLLASVASGDILPMDGSLAGGVIRSGEPLVLSSDADEVVATYPLLVAPVSQGLRSFLFVPLTSRGQVFASLGVASTQPEVYTVQHVDILGRVSVQIAPARRPAPRGRGTCGSR